MKEQLLEMYNSKRFQIMLDICRILMFLIAIAIFIKLTTNIEAVKMLMYDPCKLCENKTGSLCFYPEDINPREQKFNSQLSINLTLLDSLLKNETLEEADFTDN